MPAHLKKWIGSDLQECPLCGEAHRFYLKAVYAEAPEERAILFGGAPVRKKQRCFLNAR